jgi:hypothetical protein
MLRSSYCGGCETGQASSPFFVLPDLRPDSLTSITVIIRQQIFFFDPLVSFLFANRLTIATSFAPYSACRSTSIFVADATDRAQHQNSRLIYLQGRDRTLACTSIFVPAPLGCPRQMLVHASDFREMPHTTGV